MSLIVLSFLAGALTILSPCILPVVPFVFASVGRPFAQGGLPILAGLAVSFAGIASLATVGGAWAADLNGVARLFALAVLALLGLALVFSQLAARGLSPLMRLGQRIADAAGAGSSDGAGAVLRSVAVGIATGLLWAPCAGPILGLVLTASVLEGANIYTTGLLLSYAAGAASSLAIALLAGGRIYGLLKRSLPGAEMIRKGLGVAVLGGVALIASGTDTAVLARLSTWSLPGSLEQNLLDSFLPSSPPAQAPVPASTPAPAGPMRRVAYAAELPVEGVLPEFQGVTAWLNSAPLTRESLRGKVVLVDFWTFACVNCQHALPYVRSWYEKYKDQGLVVIGVHSPEFAFERRIDNVRRAAADMRLEFPIAIDNGFAVWKSFSNRYWPAHYFIDAEGRIRFHHFGEGEYERSEQVIRQLLEEARRTPRGKV